MQYLYIDFETYVSKKKGISLSQQTLRQYLADTYIQAVSWAWNDEPVRVVMGEIYNGVMGPADANELWDTFASEVAIAASSDNVTVICHGATFDIRVLRHMMGLQHPETVHCTIELACYAWPNEPGGHSLDNLGPVLGLEHRKINIDLFGTYTAQEMHDYVACDTEMCREIHKLALPLISEQELWVHEFVQANRELYFELDQEKVASAIKCFRDMADDYATNLAGLTGPDVFGTELDGSVRSVKPHEVKAFLADELGFYTESTSRKKINPASYATSERGQEAKEVVEQAGNVNKYLSHARRTRAFSGVDKVDCDMGHFRAHTGRASCPCSGKGLNILNMPKHDKLVGPMYRGAFKVPDGYAMVRGDAASVEYRIEGWWTGCKHIHRLYESDVMADAYIAFWKEATGEYITKGDPVRQLAKKSVLGLGFLMGLRRWMAELMIGVVDWTPAALNQLIDERNWRAPRSDYFKRCLRDTQVPEAVGIIAYHTMESFHEVHPEFKRRAEWTLDLCKRVSRTAGDVNHVIDRHYSRRGAVDRAKVNFICEPHLLGRSLSVECGNWTRTLAWRDIKIREGKSGREELTMAHKSYGERSLHPGIILENISQSMARNGLMEAHRQLYDRGYPYQLNVYDELILIVPKTCEDITRARQDMIDVCGPGNNLGYEWAWVMDPAEINASVSWYEDDRITNDEWWSRVASGDTSALELLP